MLDEIRKLLDGIRVDTRKVVEEMTRRHLNIERYDVTTAPDGSVIGVTLPFGGTELKIPYSPWCSAATVGDTVLVVWWNSLSTAQAWFMGNGWVSRLISILPGRGGIAVNGDLEVEGDLNLGGAATLTGGSTVHDAAGTGGTAGFVRVATITVTGPYANVPITITFARRKDSAPTTLFITFLSAANADPGLAYFTGTGPNPGAAQLVKRAASTWDLYVEKTEPWDRLAITEYHLTAYMQGLATVAWTDEQVNTDPGGTAASPLRMPGMAALQNRVYGTELTVAVGHDLHGLLLTDVGSVHIVWVASGRIYCTEIWNGGNTDTLTATWDSGTKTATFSYTNSHGMVYMGY